jgi:hypothetical protein
MADSDDEAVKRRPTNVKKGKAIMVEDDGDDDDVMDVDQQASTKPSSRPVVVKREVDDDDDAIMQDSKPSANGHHRQKNGSHHGIEDEADDEEEGGDPVVREIPIYFSQQLSKNLFIFQYPTRKLQQEQLPNPIAARMKPLAQRFELDIPINVQDEHYSRDKGETLAVGMDNEAIMTAYDVDRLRRGANMGGRPKFLDKQTLQSTLLPMPGNYYVGAMRDGKQTVLN